MIRLYELHKCPEKYVGDIEVSGWIKTARESKNVGFIELGDGSAFRSVQVVYEHGEIPESVSKFFATGTAITVKGVLELTPEAKQSFEIKANEVIIEGECPNDYPLQKKRHSMEYLRTILHLRPRTNTFQAVFRVRSVVAQAIHRFFDERGFVYVHTPIFTGSDCEGAGEMFRVTTLDMDNPPRTEDGKVDFQKTFRKTLQPYRQRPASRRGICTCVPRYLHVRTHIPCRKQQHRTSCRGVLADRARNGFLRPQRLHGYRRGDD